MQKITNKEGLPSPSLTTTHSTTHVRNVLVLEYGPSLSLFYSDWGGIINKYIVPTKLYVPIIVKIIKYIIIIIIYKKITLKTDYACS